MWVKAFQILIGCNSLKDSLCSGYSVCDPFHRLSIWTGSRGPLVHNCTVFCIFSIAISPSWSPVTAIAATTHTIHTYPHMAWLLCWLLCDPLLSPGNELPLLQHHGELPPGGPDLNLGYSHRLCSMLPTYRESLQGPGGQLLDDSSFSRLSYPLCHYCTSNVSNHFIYKIQAVLNLTFSMSASVNWC